MKKFQSSQLMLEKIWLILDSIENASVIGCVSLRVERAPIKKFKPKEFLESISPPSCSGRYITKKPKLFKQSVKHEEKLFPINNFGCT